MKPRKTISVDLVKSMANYRLSLPNHQCSQQEKRAICSFLEEMLSASNRYKGFQYLYIEDVINGKIKAKKTNRWAEIPSECEYSRRYA